MLVRVAAAGYFFCAKGRLHDGRCRLAQRASALVFLEVFDEQPGELLRGRIVGRLLGPRVARSEDCRWHSRTLRDDVETKYGIAPRLHAGEHAAENAVDDRACVRKFDALPDPSVLGAEITNSSRSPKLTNVGN